MLTRRALLTRAREHLAREDGQSLIFVAVSMVAIMAMGMLVIDGAREFVQHTQTQNAADEVALAAARDLDSGSGVCTAACKATLQTYAHANGISPGTTIVACDATHTTNCYSAPYNGKRDQGQADRPLHGGVRWRRLRPARQHHRVAQCLGKRRRFPAHRRYAGHAQRELHLCISGRCAAHGRRDRGARVRRETST
jgi:hypothetical protein